MNKKGEWIQTQKHTLVTTANPFVTPPERGLSVSIVGDVTYTGAASLNTKETVYLCWWCQKELRSWEINPKDKEGNSYHLYCYLKKKP